jgi:hypothetical protein
VSRVAQPTFKDGANCLFIGHSFFIPVARKFDEIAKRNNFSSHQSDIVFAPGMGGSPGSLWENERFKKKIEAKLATGKVKVLGMTAFGPRNSELKDYQQWIDMALKYNPKTRFFIGHCWTFGGPRMESERYETAIEIGGDRLFATVTQLRKAYPKNHIYFINYGKVASEMKDRLKAGQLPDIKNISGLDSSALYRDRLMGHGGPMMLELSGLCWLNVLYGAEIDKLKHTAYKSDVKGITAKVMKFNQKYQ